MICQKCQSEMVCQPRLDLTYYECRDCGSLWFNGGELENLLNRKIRLPFEPRQGEPENSEGQKECPVCGSGSRLVAKTTFATGKVLVRGCLACYGHWLTRAQARDLVNRACYPAPLGFLRRLFVRS